MVTRVATLAFDGVEGRARVEILHGHHGHHRLSRVTPTPEGAFYVYPDGTALLGREWAGSTPTTTLELADLILEHAEVAVVPGEAFGPSGYLRFSYALGDDALLEGVQRLQRLFGA